MKNILVIQIIKERCKDNGISTEDIKQSKSNDDHMRDHSDYVFNTVNSITGETYKIMPM